jgi:hypothetical protein
MAKKVRRDVEDLFTLTKTVFLDLPLAGVQWGWGFSNGEVVTETVWKGYDAGVRLATATIDNLYRLPLYGQVLNGVMPTFLHWQRVSNALTGAVFTGLWQAVGLPTRAETRALREALDHVATDLQLQRQENQELMNLVTRVVQARETESPRTPPSIFNGFVLNEQLFRPQAAPTARVKGN